MSRAPGCTYCQKAMTNLLVRGRPPLLKWRSWLDCQTNLECNVPSSTRSPYRRLRIDGAQRAANLGGTVHEASPSHRCTGTTRLSRARAAKRLWSLSSQRPLSLGASVFVTLTGAGATVLLSWSVSVVVVVVSGCPHRRHLRRQPDLKTHSKSRRRRRAVERTVNGGTVSREKNRL